MKEGDIMEQSEIFKYFRGDIKTEMYPHIPEDLIESQRTAVKMQQRSTIILLALVVAILIIAFIFA